MDPRSQRQSHPVRPTYPQTADSASVSSASSSVFQSSTSLASLSSANAATSHTLYDMPGGLQGQGFAAGPMPSPTAGQPRDCYFGSLAQAQTSSHPQQTLMPSGQRLAQNAPSCSGHMYAGQRGDGNGAPATAPYLQDFSLLAEAAKMAQMAVLTRDLGDIGL